MKPRHAVAAGQRCGRGSSRVRPYRRNCQVLTENGNQMMLAAVRSTQEKLVLPLFARGQNSWESLPPRGSSDDSMRVHCRTGRLGATSMRRRLWPVWASPSRCSWPNWPTRARMQTTPRSAVLVATHRSGRSPQDISEKIGPGNKSTVVNRNYERCTSCLGTARRLVVRPEGEKVPVPGQTRQRTCKLFSSGPS